MREGGVAVVVGVGAGGDGGAVFSPVSEHDGMHLQILSSAAMFRTAGCGAARPVVWQEPPSLCRSRWSARHPPALQKVVRHRVRQAPLDADRPLALVAIGCDRAEVAK